MAEIKYNNLYNELTPMERRFYDQVFSQQYKPNQENLMLSSQPAYDQMKAAYEAQQQVPEKNFFDSLNLFGSASAAEKPTVPNLSLGYNMPTFDLATGITNTSSASPFLKSMADIAANGNVNTDLVSRLIEQSKQKAISDFINVPQDYYPSNIGGVVPGGITETYSGVGDMGYTTPRTIADQNKVLGQTFTEQEPSGIEKLLKFLRPGNLIGSLLAGILPKESAEVRATKDFYARKYGVNSAGSVASGIMQGYNPVSGGFLNMITGGKYGEPMQVGLANAARQRIENIINRKAPQTDASRAKIQELQKFAEEDTINRARTTASDVYRDAGNKGTLGSGGGFSTSGREGAFESKSGRGRQDF